MPARLRTYTAFRANNQPLTSKPVADAEIDLSPINDEIDFERTSIARVLQELRRHPARLWRAASCRRKIWRKLWPTDCPEVKSLTGNSPSPNREANRLTVKITAIL